MNHNDWDSEKMQQIFLYYERSCSKANISIAVKRQPNDFNVFEVTVFAADSNEDLCDNLVRLASGSGPSVDAAAQSIIDKEMNV